MVFNDPEMTSLAFSGYLMANGPNSVIKRYWRVSERIEVATLMDPPLLNLSCLAFEVSTARLALNQSGKLSHANIILLRKIFSASSCVWAIIPADLFLWNKMQSKK